ncbi:NAC domain-containing protein 104-like [Ananas comosus]|uniref:NAC domain-containing protein 104-like n=2 Tax=Ananas comosus TaxID=4615 RepID=A0A199UL99_ANACO|nr:NAC domain-containing protein 104-like [Ananas comosus]OAY65667.1 NAC transcription factor NAM-1 [Ananas comosus]CAD1836889.1 unnamed protein product [Ananas comosus var. bracteatus]
MGEGTTKLPPGFHFFPSDEELVVHFLRRKVALLPCQPDIIPVVDHLHRYDPWDLDGKALQAGNLWYFFNRTRDQSGASPSGYWSPLDADEPIVSGGKDVGLKKTLIFYVGEAPQGIKTNWVMHEYHLVDGGGTSGTSSSSNRPSLKKRSHQRSEHKKWVVCRVYESSCGPPTGFGDDGTELSCLDEVFLSLDDLDEVSLPN